MADKTTPQTKSARPLYLREAEESNPSLCPNSTMYCDCKRCHPRPWSGRWLPATGMMWAVEAILAVLLAVVVGLTLWATAGGGGGP